MVNKMHNNWKLKKPEDWTIYQWENLRTLNSISYHLKRLADSLDSVDLTTHQSKIEAIVDSTVQSMYNTIKESQGHYTGTQKANQGHYTGHYSQ